MKLHLRSFWNCLTVLAQKYINLWITWTQVLTRDTYEIPETKTTEKYKVNLEEGNADIVWYKQS